MTKLCSVQNDSKAMTGVARSGGRLLLSFIAASTFFQAPPVLSWPEMTSRGAFDIDITLPSPPQAPASETEDALAFYQQTLDAQVQAQCLTCHKAGGVAPQSGARLVLSDNTARNHDAFVELLSHQDVAGSLVLNKVIGQAAHGGGVIVAKGSSFYRALEEYLSLLGEDVDSSSSALSEAFWSGTAAEARDITLRRAALLFSASIPSPESLTMARESEEGLRSAISELMEGPKFREFILRGANDQLLVEGLLNGINFDISTRDRYPTLSKLMSELPEDRPEKFEDYHDKPFLTRWDADWSFRWAITREPLELIAHIVTNDMPYQQVLTADFTMVNAFSDLAYRASTGLDHDFADQQGFYDRSRYNQFIPGQNNGHIPHDEAFEANEEEGIVSHSGYQIWPHAGVLSTQAWLARYPSTDTNRNRARARWTYMQFLGVDIEKSAPRTTDPIALADTNNPTMNNTACTVCHERLDPVAGAYQSFGNLGHYLDQYGGEDSLADSYKCPECYGGDVGSSLYRQGDTWYRDMRSPGFEGDTAKGPADSLQWLGAEIANDPRFAAATVRFWWPAIFGTDPLIAPGDDQAEDFSARLAAYEEQDTLIKELASRFEASNFNARALFVDMVMSPWFRHSVVTDVEAVSARQVELATVGRGRLLGPEELDRKNLAVFGRTWRQWNNGDDPHSFSRETALTGFRASFKGFYGGIDSAAVTARNREMTPLMSSVTESMAADLACQIVVEDFNRPAGQRVVFDAFTRSELPGQLLDIQSELPGKVSDMRLFASHSIEGSISTVEGPTRLRIRDVTGDPHQSLDDQWTGAELIVEEIVVRRGNAIVRRIEGDDLSKEQGFGADQWQDDEGIKHWRGHSEEGVGWRLHPGAWVEIEPRLEPGDYQIEIRLGTSLLENNILEAMQARVTATALDNLDQTQSWKKFDSSVRDLISRALVRPPTDQDTTRFIDLLVQSASAARDRGDWFFDEQSRCDTWSIWPGEELTHAENIQRYGDSEGTMRAWAAALHGLMTSYEYLHD